MILPQSGQFPLHSYRSLIFRFCLVTLQIIIIIDYFYIALFSALEQTHCTRRSIMASTFSIISKQFCLWTLCIREYKLSERLKHGLTWTSHYSEQVASPSPSNTGVRRRRAGMVQQKKLIKLPPFSVIIASAMCTDLLSTSGPCTRTRRGLEKHSLSFICCQAILLCVKSLQEQWEIFFLQGQLSVLTLILVSVPPPCYRSST